MTTQPGLMNALWTKARLQTKFLFISIPLVVLVTATLFYYIHFTTTQSDRDRLDDRIAQITQIAAQTLSGLVWSFNEPQIQLFMSAIINDADIVGARVLDESGQVLGDSGNHDISGDNIFQQIETLTFLQPGQEEAQVIGQLELTYTTERLTLDAQRRFWTNLVTISVLTLSVILSATAALHLAVHRPLNSFLMKIRADQSERRSAEPQDEEDGTLDEVSTVVRAYNSLQKQQRAYELELTAIKDGLEQSVEDRTRDLRQERDRAADALETLKGTQARLVQSQKMASLGQLTAGIAHEIKNPLNFVNNFASLSKELLSELIEALEREVAHLPVERREEVEDLIETLISNLQKINDHGRRADSIVKNMLLHSREGSRELSQVDINDLAEEAIGLVYHAARAERSSFNITIHKQFDEDMPQITCYAQEILRVFINIMSNGMYAANKRHENETAGDGPQLTVRTRFEGNVVHIEIEDNGDGIAPDDRDRIFLPFYTTKPAGDGTGLGLSLSFDIVETQHGGHLGLDTVVGQFTRFTITLPVKARQDAATKDQTT